MSARYWGPRTIRARDRHVEQGRGELRRAPQIFIQAPPRVPGPPAPPGSVEALAEQIDRVRDRDLRSPSRITVDRVWKRAKADVQNRFGRKLSLDGWQQASVASELALRSARDAEAAYVALAIDPRAPRAACDEALNRLCTLVADYLNVATAGWPAAAVHLEAERRRLEDWA